MSVDLAFDVAWRMALQHVLAGATAPTILAEASSRHPVPHDGPVSDTVTARPTDSISEALRTLREAVAHL